MPYMVARNRLPPWHDELRLANGRELLIRPVRGDDAAPLRASFPLFKPAPVRERLLAGRPELETAQVTRLTHPDPRTEFALVATERLPPGEALVAALGHITTDTDRNGELVVLVSQHIDGMGVGRQLLRRLTRWARGKRLAGLHGHVAQDNEPMLQLATSLGFRAQPAGDDGMVEILLEA